MISVFEHHLQGNKKKRKRSMLTNTLWSVKTTLAQLFHVLKSTQQIPAAVSHYVPGFHQTFKSQIPALCRGLSTDSRRRAIRGRLSGSVHYASLRFVLNVLLKCSHFSLLLRHMFKQLSAGTTLKVSRRLPAVTPPTPTPRSTSSWPCYAILG